MPLQGRATSLACLEGGRESAMRETEACCMTCLRGDAGFPSLEESTRCCRGRSW